MRDVLCCQVGKKKIAEYRPDAKTKQRHGRELQPSKAADRSVVSRGVFSVPVERYEVTDR